MKYIRFLFICLFALHCNLQATEDIADVDSMEEQEVKEPPFNPLHRVPSGGLQTLFLPGPAIFDPTYGDFTRQNRLYVGAGTAGMKGYAITSFVALRSSQPVIPETVFLNREADQPHPLYDQKVNHMKLSGQTLAAITEKDCNRVSIVEGFGNPSTYVLQTEPIKDLKGESDTRITNIAIGATSMVEGELRHYVFASIKDNQGYDSLALTKIDSLELLRTMTDEDGNEEEELYTVPEFRVLDAQTGEAHGNRPLDLKEVISTIGECDSYEITDLCWEQLLERLYITLRVTNSNIEDQASWTILMGRVVNDQLIVEPCMPVSYARHSNKGFLAYGKGATEYLDGVVTYKPSSGGIYALVQRGSMLYSYPVVNKSKKIEKQYRKNVRAYVMKDPEQGALAYQPAGLQEHCRQNTKRIQERYFEQPLQGSMDEEQKDFISVVGGFVVLPGPIERIEFSGDAVLAAVKQTDGDELAGLFLSQPIYDAHGTVAAWSGWERIAVSKQPTVYGCFDCESDSYVTLEYMLGDDNQLHGKVRMTAWEDCKKVASEDPFIGMLNSQFNVENGGISSIQSYDGITVVVGPSRVMIADIAKEFTDFNVEVASSYDGSLSILNDKQSVAAVEVCGGQLGIDPYLVDSTVVHDGNQYWLCCAGTGGIFVLAHPDGSGVKDMRDYCTSLAHTMQFKKISDFSRVKKIIASNQYLYILTARSCERYSLETQERVVLVTPNQLESGLFNDMIVSGNIMLLATMNGVYYVQNGSVQSIQSADELIWDRVDLIQNPDYPVKKFFAVTQTGKEVDAALGSQIFAVGTSSRLQQTTIHRLFCKEDTTSLHRSINLVPGYVLKDVPLGFISCGSQRDGIYVNGAQTITYRCRVGDEVPFMEFAASHLKTRSGVYARDLGRMRYSPGIKHAYVINGIFLEPVTGRLIVYGDFGARVHK